MQKKVFDIGITFESNTLYVADRPVYDIYWSDSFEEINCWWTTLSSVDLPLKAAFVLKRLKNVIIDLNGAKMLFHGRIMPFAVYDCENIHFKNFSIDYDRPFFTQGLVLESEPGSVEIQISEEYPYRIEGHDFIAMSDTWEHRLVKNNLLFRCMIPETGRMSSTSDFILGLIGDVIEPMPNPPATIHHLYADDLGDHKVKIWNLPNEFLPRVGEILAITHEDRRKPGFVIERCIDTIFEHVRLLHIGGMGIIANLCHNITLDHFDIYVDESMKDRIITINADGFHCFHCSGLMKVVNCRLENMLDDAINIHGNYLICQEQIDDRTITVQNLSAGIKDIQYLCAGDEVVIYCGNTQEVRCVGIVESAEYFLGQHVDMKVILKSDIPINIQKGDCLESCRMPEIEICNCRVKCNGGFRISSGKKVIIKDCYFENGGFSILFSGDMNYWYENGPVKDVTICNCTFDACRWPVMTQCYFTPTKNAPYYHENIRFYDNTITNPVNSVLTIKDVNGIEYRRNKIVNAREDFMIVNMINCDHVTME